MELRIIAAASLVALAAQGCYRPMYAPPYGYSSQGYPIGNGYPGSIQTTTPSQQYVPGTMPPMNTQPGGIPTYNTAPGGPTTAVPVPPGRDAATFQAPIETQGGRELGFAPAGSGLIQTAGTAPAFPPNQFAPADAQPMAAQPTFAESAPTPAPNTVTSDSFQGGDSPTVFR
jgi:hypothetical protein